MDKLPLELIIKISSFLPLTDTWRLRSVSKHLNHNLSSTTARSAAIHRYETHSSSDSAFPIGLGNDDLDRREDLVRQHYLGSPLRSLIEAEHMPTGDNSRVSVLSSALKGRYLATAVRVVQRSTHHVVIVRDLVSQEAWRLYTAAEYTYKVILTEELVAFRTFEALYVAKLSDQGDRPARRLDTIMMDPIDMAGHKQKIVLLGRVQDLKICIYDFDTYRLEYFDLDMTYLLMRSSPSHVFTHGLLVDTNSESVNIFTSGFNEDDDALRIAGPPKKLSHIFHHKRIGFDGSTISQRYFLYGVQLGQMMPEESNVSVAAIQPIGVPGRYHFNVMHRDSSAARHALIVSPSGRAEVFAPPELRYKRWAIWKDLVFHSTRPFSRMSVSRMTNEERMVHLGYLQHDTIQAKPTNEVIQVNDAFVVWTCLSTRGAPHHVFVYDGRAVTQDGEPLCEVEEQPKKILSEYADNVEWRSFLWVKAKSMPRIRDQSSNDESAESS